MVELDAAVVNIYCLHASLNQYWLVPLHIITFIMPITGANIPPELFSNILAVLNNVGSHYMKPDRSTGFVAANKRELGTCSLVNRYWAGTCQPRIFGNITLRCAQDIYTLLSFLDHPRSRLTKYITLINIAPIKSSGPPWVHLLPSIYPRLEKEWWFQVVELEGPFPNSLGCVRSIHRTPRAIPMFSQNIDNLILRNIPFRRFHDFLALINELRQLTKISGIALTWPEDDEELIKIPRKRARVQFSRVAMSECTANWCALWLVAAYSSIEDPPLGVDEWTPFVWLARALETGLPRRCTERTLKVEDSASPSLQYNGIVGETSYRTPCVTGICSVVDGGLHRSIRCIAVDFVAGLDPNPRIDFEDTLNCDWKDFDHQLFCLRQLQKVVFGFQSVEDLERFSRDVVSCSMSHLSSNTNFKVVWAVWKHQPDKGIYDGTWQYVFPGSEKMEDSGMDFLDEL